MNEYAPKIVVLLHLKLPGSVEPHIAVRAYVLTLFFINHLLICLFVCVKYISS